MSLQPSKLSDQLEALGDIDLSSLNLAVKGKASMNILKQVTGATITRTIDGASTLEVNLRDRDRVIWNSGYIAEEVDVEIDGLFFRLVSYNKSGDDVTLTFEDREVALLRDYPKPFDPKRYLARPSATTTRLQFAEFLVKQVTEITGGIRFVTPHSFAQLLEDSPLPVKKTERQHARGLGFAPGAVITVKRKTATAEQLSNIDRVLQTGTSLKARRKLLVASVMVITQESDARTSATNGVHVGLFQQSAAAGWPATRVPEADATAFFEAAITEDAKHPNVADWQLAEDVQASGQGNLYSQWKTEAERTVDAWGATTEAPPSSTLTATDKSYQFTRGTLTYGSNGKKVFTREDNWSCLQRLASEVNWRCFAVSGTVYFMPDLDLLASQPQMTLTEKSDGVDTIDGSGDEGRQSIRKGHRVQQLNQQATIPCRIARWAAPPGSSVELDECGPMDGRWLVASIRRDLFKPDATITLKRPQAALPEARAPEYLDPSGGAVYAPPTDGAITTGGAYVAPGTLVKPIPEGFYLNHGAVHPTGNLPGYPAIDFMAHAGSPVIAPESGTITRLSGNDPAVGPIGGPHGALGWSIYLAGDSGTTYFITHLATRTVRVGQKVSIAEQIGTVADFAKWGGVDHTHVGVNGGPITIEMLGAAPLAQKPVPLRPGTR